MSSAPLSTSHKKVEYATANDIQKHFVAAMNDLYCLAFLLTANADRAEDCVIRSIRECLKSRNILRESLPGWVRDTVVRNGIKIAQDIEGFSIGDTPRDSIPLVPESSQPFVGTTDYSAGILELSHFERLVYVIFILEHYASQQCALLLGRSREEVREARNRALAHIAEFESTWRDIGFSRNREER